MANVSRVFGLRSVKNLHAAPYNSSAETFAILAADGTATFVGDLVKSAGTADANGVQAVIRMAADADLPTGVVVGFLPDYSNLNTPAQYRLASTLRYAMVEIDPGNIYEIQATAATVIADIGLNVGLTYTAGSTATGQSGMIANMATKATTNTLPLKIVGVVQRPDQDMTDSANWKLLVTLNTANFGNGPGAAGT